MTTTMTAIMDGIGALLTLAPNVYAWPVESIRVPCAVVGAPSTIEFDLTMGRGADRWVVPVWYVVGKSGTNDAWEGLSTVLNDTSSVKSALDGAQSFGDVRVTGAEVAELTVAGVTYLAARFDCEVYG